MNKCNHELTERYNNYYDDRGIIEYSIRCTDCKKHIGTWSYGAWFEEEEEEEEEGIK